MTELHSWRVLNKGRSADVVLAADFNIAGRREAGFADLVPRLDPGLAVWETDPPRVGDDFTLSGNDYVDRWATAVRTTGRPVRAVLGFCAGSVFAAELAGRIEGWQGDPVPLILVDPEVPVARTVQEQFHLAVDHMLTVLTPQERVATQEAARRALAEDPDLAVFGPRLMKIFRESGQLAFDRVGLNPAGQEEMFTTVSSFISFVVAAAQLDPVPGWAKATAVTSATEGSGTGAEHAARRLPFDVEHINLLRHEGVAAAIAGLLG
ncbi:hypothetical protein JOF56_009053 [Kibdelosporangium banguiense]|uniref:Thioesterase domain-containing protein n=1 Tax=Kibdelosporangium banguiense TaxID=1365924 RepID=A0ABS4TW96_9PSEU|nr:hypothetical protein [Kibdelosporangium banguiense]MBP2328668.1 hypothetical protein [Kibdelosporangium banguiense]